MGLDNANALKQHRKNGSHNHTSLRQKIKQFQASYHLLATCSKNFLSPKNNILFLLIEKYLIEVYFRYSFERKKEGIPT
jgi:hypothetical protein